MHHWPMQEPLIGSRWLYNERAQAQSSYAQCTLSGKLWQLEHVADCRSQLMDNIVLVHTLWISFHYALPSDYSCGDEAILASADTFQ